MKISSLGRGCVSVGFFHKLVSTQHLTMSIPSFQYFRNFAKIFATSGAFPVWHRQLIFSSGLLYDSCLDTSGQFVPVSIGKQQKTFSNSQMLWSSKLATTKKPAFGVGLKLSMKKPGTKISWKCLFKWQRVVCRYWNVGLSFYFVFRFRSRCECCHCSTETNTVARILALLSPVEQLHETASNL